MRTQVTAVPVPWLDCAIVRKSVEIERRFSAARWLWCSASPSTCPWHRRAGHAPAPSLLPRPGQPLPSLPHLRLDFFLGTLGRRLFLSRFRVCVRGRYRYLPVFPFWLSPLGFSSRAINTRHGSGANSHNGKAPLPVKSDEFQDVQETCCDDGCSDRRATPVDQAVMVVRMSINPSSPVG